MPAAAAARSWEAPLTISPGQAYANAVSLDSAGNALAVWRNAHGIFAATRPRGGGFAAASEVVSTPDNGAGIWLGGYGAGGALVEWDGPPPPAPAPGDDALFADRPPGSGFGPPRPAASDVAPPFSGMAVGTDGSAALVWMPESGTSEDVTLRPADGSFGPALAVGHAGTANVATAAIDPHGDVIVGWDDYDAGPTISYRPAGGSFGAPRLLESNTLGDVEVPSVAFDGAGDMLVAWVSPGGLKASFTPAGAAAGPVEVASGPGATIGRFDETPQVAFDAAGDATIAFERSDGGVDRAYVVDRPAGGDFGPAQPVSPAGEDVDAVRLAVSSRGDAAITWRGFDSSRDTPQPQVGGPTGRTGPVEATVRPAGGGFATPQRLTASGGFDPSVAVDPAGNAIVTFGQFYAAHGCAQLEGAAYTDAPRSPTEPPKLTCTSDGPALFPSLAVSAPASQRPLTTGAIRFSASCDEACAGTATLTIPIASLARARRPQALVLPIRLGSGVRRSFELRIPRRLRRALRVALAHRRGLAATLVVVVRDHAGHRARVSRALSLRR